MDTTTPSNDTGEPTQCPGDVYALNIDTLEYVVNFYVLTGIAFVGLIGNTMSYLVMNKETKKTSSTFILKVLSIADILVLLFTFFYFSMPALYDNTGLALWYKIFHEAFAKNIFGICLWISKTLSIYLTLLVTAERFYAVTWPLKAPTVCTLAKAKKGVAGVVIFSILYNVPKYLYFPLFRYRYVPCLGVMPVGDSLLEDTPKWYFYGYVLGLYMIIIYAIPLTLLSVLNILLVNALRKSRLQRQEMTSASKKQDRVTEKVVGIVTAFIILETPSIIVNIIAILFPGSTDFKTLLRLLVFPYVFGALNSVINFYIYILLGEKFRQRLLQMLGCRKKLERGMSSMRTGVSVTIASSKIKNEQKTPEMDDNNKV